MPKLPSVVLVSVLLVALLAGCSSAGGAGVLSTAPTVSPNGQHYAYAQGSLPSSQWPRACSLLSTDSAAAAVGTAVTATTFHDRCLYTPGNDAFPVLTVTILGLGNEQQGTYDSVRSQNSAAKPVAVSGLGRAAIVYSLSTSPTTVLDLLASQGVFEIALRSPVGNEVGASRAHMILGQIGKTLADEFSG